MTDIAPDLRLAAGHRHFDHRLAPYCAIEKGYFAAEGIGPVSIEATGHDDLTIARLLDGEIDIALDISPAKILTAHVMGEPLVIVGALCNGVGQVLTGVKSLNSVEDLRGKRINVVETGTGVDWHPLRILLRKKGIDPDHDVTLVKHAPYPLFSNARKTFENNEADARMILHAEIPYILQAGYPVLFDFQAEYPQDYPQRSIVTTRAFLQAHRGRLVAFLRAMIRAYRLLRDEARYGEAMAIAYRNIHDEGLGFPAGITEHFLKSHYFGFKQMPSDGAFSIPSLQRYIDEEALEGRIDPALRAADVTDLRPALDALAGL